MQLPGGDLYAPALHQAASKTADRSGLSSKNAKALTDLVAASVAVLNSGDANMITLEMRVHDDSVGVKVVGKGCTSPTKKLVKQLTTLAAKKARSFESKSTSTAHTISFDV